MTLMLGRAPLLFPPFPDLDCMYQYPYRQHAQGAGPMGHVPPYGGGEYPQYPGQASSSQMFMTPPPSQPSPYSSGYQQQPYYGSGGGNAAQPLPSFGVPAGYQQQGGYLPPPPGPPQQPYNLGIDPNVFRGYYLYELQQLTFNSKPIINGLTVLAQEHSHRMGPIVAQCLDEHIRQVRRNGIDFYCDSEMRGESWRPEICARLLKDSA